MRASELVMLFTVNIAVAVGFCPRGLLLCEGQEAKHTKKREAAQKHKSSVEAPCGGSAA